MPRVTSHAMLGLASFRSALGRRVEISRMCTQASPRSQACRGRRQVGLPAAPDVRNDLVLAVAPLCANEKGLRVARFPRYTPSLLSMSADQGVTAQEHCDVCSSHDTMSWEQQSPPRCHTAPITLSFLGSLPMRLPPGSARARRASSSHGSCTRFLGRASQRPRR